MVVCGVLAVCLLPFTLVGGGLLLSAKLMMDKQKKSKADPFDKEIKKVSDKRDSNWCSTWYSRRHTAGGA